MFNFRILLLVKCIFGFSSYYNFYLFTQGSNA